jgi:hypothetical protein
MSELETAVSESQFFSKDRVLVEKLEVLEEKWRSLYPSLDLAREVRQADLWLETHTNRRPRQMSRFLSTWFRKAEEFREPTLADRRQKLKEKYGRV